MSASERDREFMRRIGRYKAESHDRAAEQHRTRPLEDRLLQSWLLYLAGRDTASADRVDDQPEQFYAIARARGLCPE